VNLTTAEDVKQITSYFNRISVHLKLTTVLTTVATANAHFVKKTSSTFQAYASLKFFNAVHTNQTANVSCAKLIKFKMILISCVKTVTTVIVKTVMDNA